MKALAILRDAEWLNASRARAYGHVLAVALAGCAIWILAARFRHGGAAQRPADDFLTFLAAGEMVRAGHAASIYDMEAFTATLNHYAIMGEGRLPFLYPPIMLILCGWITRLPEVLAYLAFELVTLVPLLICLWLMLPRRFAIIPLLIAPAFLMNFGSGQTGFFPALAYAGGALLMDSNPIAAGMSLGLLLFKPHFALLVPLVLAVSANWRAFFACGATAAGLAALSLLAFPVQVWIEFFNQPGLMKYMLEHGSNILLSVGPFGALRAAGASLPLAYTIQALTAAVVLSLLLSAAYKKARHEPAPSQRRSGRGLIALTAAGSVLFSPYAQDYDLSVIMVPVVWLAASALRTGWRPWEKLIAALVYLLPLFARITVLLTHVQPAPVLLLAFFVLIWRRTGQDRTRLQEERKFRNTGEGAPFRPNPAPVFKAGPASGRAAA